MDEPKYRILAIKNKHLRLVARLATGTIGLCLVAAIAWWAWAVALHPVLGYSYPQVLGGWFVISLAADRVRLWIEPWQREQRYRRLGLHHG